MKLTFLGAAGTVTGSRYLLEVSHKKILIDCGLFQGSKTLRLRNRAPFPISAEEIDAIILTHAHIDHSGYLPVLVKNRFHGKIYCSKATAALSEVLLLDCAYLQEEEAYFANKWGYSKHAPALPLYTNEDAVSTLHYFEPVEFEKTYALGDGISFELHRVGHIIGAAAVLIHTSEGSILFSGDLGRSYDPIMNSPERLKGADYIVVESTYGNRLHKLEDTESEIEKVVNATIKRGGSVIVPTCAVGRSQLLLYYLYQLKKARKIPDVPIFLDSPMAIEACKLFCEYSSDHGLSAELAEKVCNTAHCTNTQVESKKINNNPVPAIIIAGSGMASGGRILHHLKLFAPDPRSTILFTGHQVQGTRGDRLLSGEKEVKIHGEMVPVNAEVVVLDNTSAHADYREMLEWLGYFETIPKRVFVTHGEPASATALAEKITERFHWTCHIPQHLEEVIL